MNQATGPATNIYVRRLTLEDKNFKQLFLKGMRFIRMHPNGLNPWDPPVYYDTYDAQKFNTITRPFQPGQIVMLVAKDSTQELVIRAGVVRWAGLRESFVLLLKENDTSGETEPGKLISNKQLYHPFNL